MKSVHSLLLQTIKDYIDRHITMITTSLNNKNKTKRFKAPKGSTFVTTGTPFITNESLITFDRIVGNPATSIANIGVDGDYFVDGGKIYFKEFNKDIVISCGVNYGTHDISQADILGQKTTEADISKMKHEVDMLSGSGIGYDGIYYIQDAGSKMQGKIYLDKTQEGIWKCLKTTTSINNTSDFERIDSTTLDDKLRNLCSRYVSRDYPYTTFDNTAGIKVLSDTIFSHRFEVTVKGTYIIASTLRCSSTVPADCTIAINVNDDYYGVAFSLTKGYNDSMYEMTSSITRVVYLNPGDIVDITRSKAEVSKPQRTISLVRI